MDVTLEVVREVSGSDQSFFRIELQSARVIAIDQEGPGIEKITLVASQMTTEHLSSSTVSSNSF